MIERVLIPRLAYCADPWRDLPCLSDARVVDKATAEMANYSNSKEALAKNLTLTFRRAPARCRVCF